MNWEFKHEESTYAIVSEGKHRCIIENAEMAVSKKGNDMLIITLKFDNDEPSLRHYIVFMDDKPEITNRMLTQFFDSFGIEEGNFEVRSYIGKAGACQIKHQEDPNYGTQARVSYFIKKSLQDGLPAWRGDATVVNPYDMEDVSDDDMPF